MTISFRRPRTVAGAAVVAAFLAGCAHQTGIASVYWEGTKTASGEPLDPYAMTAAHKSLPFGTKVKVKNLDNGRTATVRINDRGPFVPGRVIDLSLAAAQTLGIDGLAHVRLTW